MKKPIEPALPVQPRTEEHEREERPERSEPCRQEFFMDIPRAGARERLAAAERKKKAGR